MSDEFVKFHLKIGTCELSFEGSKSNLDEPLEKLFGRLADLIGRNARQESPDLGNASISGTVLGSKSRSLMMSSTTCAQRLAVDSGSDLILAVSAKLMLMDGKDSFDRKDLLREMKSASIYYKKSYATNLSRYLQSLIKTGQINSLSNDKYALAAEKLEELQRVIQSPTESKEPLTQDREENVSENTEN